MVKFSKLILSIAAISVLASGCKDNNKPMITTKPKKNVIEVFKEEQKKIMEEDSSRSIPPLVLPSVYQEPELLDIQKNVTFSAVEAPLTKVLFLISKELGMNIVFSDDVDSLQKITLNMNNASAKDALDVTMNISDNYYEIQGNIIYIKKYKTEIFKLPFVNATPNSSSSLGGNMLGSKDESLRGTYQLDYKSSEEANNFYVQIENSLKNILTLEPEDEDVTAETDDEELTMQVDAGRYALNKFSGTLIVTDTKSKLKQVAELVERIDKFTSKQVLIEAKILEVVLDDGHQLGINWSNTWNTAEGIIGASQALNVNSGVLGAVTSPISSANAVSLSYTANNFNAVLNAIQSSGDTELVSNPRIKVMNGQPGILTSGNIVPYWEKSVEFASQQDPNDNTKFILTPTVTYDKLDVLNGISLGVTPIIKDNGKIILNIVPIITSIEGEKTFTDEGNDVAVAPILNVKETGTTIITEDNSMIVIGGLITSTEKKELFKTPILGDIPYLGDIFFKRTESVNQRRESVIILKINVNELAR